MQLLCFVYHCINNLTYSKVFVNYFVTNKAIHLHGTRQSGNLHCRFARTKVCASSAKIAGPKFWNVLPLEIRNALSLFVFKRRLVAWLLLRYTDG